MMQENMLARYKVLHELGRGAMGAVYAARDRDTGGVVALKRLDPASLKSEANLAGRFLKHARSARLLTHRNIVKIHDAGEVGGTVYVAMEMLEGESLGKILREPLPIARAIQIARDIACGLAHAHLEGVVHGSLKPSDIIVSPSGVAKITDFGMGQPLSAAPAGSLRYLSPEQLRGDPVDHRCDIFSLGALFYEMLTHRAPFAGDSAKEILENILHAKPPLPSELNPHVPRALDAIVSGMLAAQPAARMPGVPVLLRGLQGLEEGLGLGSGAAAGSDESKASAPLAEPEPKLEAPEPDRSGERVSVQPSPQAPQYRKELQRREPTTHGEAFDDQKAIALMERESRRERVSGSRPAIFAALALAVLIAGGAAFAYYAPGSSDRSIVSHMQKALATASKVPAPARMVSRPIAPAPVANATGKPAKAPVAPPLSVGDGQAAEKSPDLSSAENQLPPKLVAQEARPSAPTEEPAPRTSKQAGTAPTRASRREMQPTEEAPQQPGGTARVILSVSPRGEIYIDGKHHGTTPPITTFDLEPGMHSIELRSGSRTPYLTYVTVQTGDVRRIRHDFDVSQAVYPSKRASWQKSRRAAR